MTTIEARCAQHTVLYSEPDRGTCNALDKGPARAGRVVIRFLNADDLYADTEVLVHIVAAFADPAVVVVYDDQVSVCRADIGRVIRYWCAKEYTSARLHWGWMTPYPTLYLHHAL